MPDKTRISHWSDGRLDASLPDARSAALRGAARPRPCRTLCLVLSAERLTRGTSDTARRAFRQAFRGVEVRGRREQRSRRWLSAHAASSPAYGSACLGVPRLGTGRLPFLRPSPARMPRRRWKYKTCNERLPQTSLRWTSTARRDPATTAIASSDTTAKTFTAFAPHTVARVSALKEECRSLLAR
eukprot:scaffold3428_cov379-Prasinococcus_capsulatus_cf.AAC.28